MEPDQIIERLDSENPPTAEELATAATELVSAQDALRKSIKEHKGTLSELRALKADYDSVTAALGKISEAQEASQAELDAILAEVGDPEDDDNGSDDETEGGDEADEVEAEAVPVAASIRQTLARVRQTPRVEVTERDERDLSRVDTSYTLLGRDREELTAAEIGKAFADTARTKRGSKTTVMSIKTELHPDRTLNGDASANERKMLDLFGANPMVPVTAAGGCCSIPEPIYDQPLIGSLARPIRDAFDVMNASRGAVQAYPPVCLPDEGADIWTCAQDEAVDPDDPDTWKSCVQLDCDEEEPTVVEPIYKCLTVGTFQQRFAPEQWEAFVFQVDKLAARKAEARLFNWLAQSATSVYDAEITTGSTYANFIKTQLRLAAAMRQDQRLGETQLITVGPEWIFDAIAEDTLTRRLNSTDEVELWKERVNRVLRDHGITYVGSDDISAMSAFSYDGALPNYPGEAPMVTIPAGAAKVLDGGEKNLGVDFVDFELARQNKVGAFSEFWEGLLVRNCNVVFSTIAVEDCDLTCPGA